MSTQPNILFFFPDGFQGRIVRDEECITPNLDALAARGVTVTNAHAALPTCSPSRASVMTGVYPHNHGVLEVEHVVPDDQSVLRTEYVHWAQRLSEAGYKTGYFGKWHIERTNELEQFGWQVNGCDQMAAFRDLGAGVEDTGSLLERATLQRSHSGPEGYRDILHYAVADVSEEERPFWRNTENAIEFIRTSSKSSQPWACTVSFPEPNVPLIAGLRAFECYDPDSVTLPESLNDSYENKPALYRRIRNVFSGISDKEWKELRTCYMALVTELDEQLGRLISALKESDSFDNTIIIVSGDHGRYLGAHGMDAHNFGAFEEIYNVPLVVAGPGVANGKTSESHVSLIDLCPTIIELAGATPIENIDGSSFAALLADPDGSKSDFTTSFAEYHGTRFPLMQRIVWKERWKFVFNGFDYDELYDLANDPNELTNLASDSRYAETVKELMGEIWAEARRTGDKKVLESHYAPMRFGVVGPEYGNRSK